jgi:hypothetical protein
MKKICKNIFSVLLTAALLTAACAVTAQTHEAGFGGAMFHQKGTLISSYDPGSLTGAINLSTPYDKHSGSPAVCYAYYHPLVELNDALYFGGQAAFFFYGYYEKQDDVQNFSGQTIADGSSSDLIIGWEVPVYANIRLMNGSEESNDEGFGLGGGLGMMAHGFNVINDKGFMFTPAAMVEVKYNKLGLRFDYQFKHFKSVYTTETGDIPRMETNFFSVLLTFRFLDE